MPAPRILHIVGDSKFGGGSRIIAALALSAKSAGFNVDVLTTDDAFQGFLKDAGIGVVALPVIWRDMRPFRDVLGLMRLARFLRRHRYSIVHTHTSKAGFIGRLAASIGGVPAIVHTVHGFAFHEGSGNAAMLAYTALERAAACWCHRIVTVSRFHCDWALRLGIGNATKVIPIPNGIDYLPQPDGTRERYRTLLDANADEVIILSAGRLAPQKGLEYLFDAVLLLESTLHSPFRVVLAGEGTLRTLLEEKAKHLGIRHRIQFLGFRDDISALITASDVVVLPTLREGLSIALLEAMAAAKPIITTSIGSNREVCGSSECAVLVPPKDPRALAAAVIELIQRPDRGEDLGRKARIRFQENYTLHGMVSAYRQLYLQLLES